MYVTIVEFELDMKDVKSIYIYCEQYNMNGLKNHGYKNW